MTNEERLSRLERRLATVTAAWKHSRAGSVTPSQQPVYAGEIRKLDRKPRPTSAFAAGARIEVGHGSWRLTSKSKAKPFRRTTMSEMYVRTPSMTPDIKPTLSSP